MALAHVGKEVKMQWIEKKGLQKYEGNIFKYVRIEKCQRQSCYDMRVGVFLMIKVTRKTDTFYWNII